MEIFREDINKLARHNTSFRRVLSTGPHSQIVAMSLAPGEDLGEEVHFADQLFIVEKGEGEVIVEGMSTALKKGELVHVPGGVHHNVVASADETLKLIVVYAPAHHAPDANHLTKADAAAAEADAEVSEIRAMQREFAQTRSRILSRERI
jgi:mannose-6-phosphate isomerase-like protein (cupin superfamily)